jgi:hypothetical protein
MSLPATLYTTTFPCCLTGPCLSAPVHVLHESCSHCVIYEAKSELGEISCLSNHVPSPCFVALEHVPHEMCSHCVILGEQIRSYMNLMSLHHVPSPCFVALEHVPHEMCSHCVILGEQIRSCMNLMSLHQAFPTHVSEHKNMFLMILVPTMSF